MGFLSSILHHNKELAIFLTIALGFTVGRIQIASFRIGGMLGSLLAGMVVGMMNIDIPPTVKLIFFDLFLFATGYKVGPQFFHGIQKNAWGQIFLTVVICVACLMTTYFISKLMGYDVGTASGLLAGAFSESTVVGTAGSAIQELPLGDAEKATLINNIPVAYAITYIIGTIGNVWFLSFAAPRLMRINLKEEAGKLGVTISGEAAVYKNLHSLNKDWIIRSFRLDGSPWTGMTISQVESSVPGARILVERVRSGNAIMDPSPGMILKEGDTIVVAARQQVMIEKLTAVGQEVLDKELLNLPLQEAGIVITKKEIAGKTLGELAMEHSGGIMLEKLVRGGEQMPLDPSTVVHLSDTLIVSGRQADLDRATKAMGHKERKGIESDLIFAGAGILIGGLFGLLSWRVFGIALTLGTSGGALVAGLFFGWIHSRVPDIGYIPPAALWLMDNLGLATFLGIVGIGAGPTFIAGFRHIGLSIVLAGAVVGVLPHMIGMIFGRFILRMNPVMLLGAQSGAGTSTTALKAIQDAAGSKLPVLGYTIPYALGNIILTAWGPVIVSLMTNYK